MNTNDVSSRPARILRRFVYKDKTYKPKSREDKVRYVLSQKEYSTVQDVVEKFPFNNDSETTRTVLRKMMEKGLVHSVEKNGETFYKLTNKE